MMNIVCIGAGKLANQLMPELERAGCNINQIYNRRLDQAESLADTLSGADVTDQLNAIEQGADLYFLAIKDDAIVDVASQLSFLENANSIFVHSSGILALDALPFKRRGIFYPLQTFSLHHPVNWKNTPILITADTAEVNEKLLSLAKKISNLVYPIADQDKAILHLGAVFANNFTNHMLALSEALCKKHNVSFEILKPLIRETLEKAMEVGAAESQTGPAIRGDQHTIEKHLMLLQDDAKLQELYQKISESIMRPLH